MSIETNNLSPGDIASVRELWRKLHAAGVTDPAAVPPQGTPVAALPEPFVQDIPTGHVREKTADVKVSPDFAEPAAAAIWNDDANPSQKTSLRLVDTDGDLEGVRAVALTEIDQQIIANAANPEVVESLREKRRTIAGAKHISEIRQASGEAQNIAVAAGGAMESPEEHKTRLRQEIKVLEKEVHAGVEAAVAKGDISAEDAKKLRDEHAKIETLPEGEAKDKAIANEAKTVLKVMPKAIDTAAADGREEDAEKHKETMRKAEEVRKKMEELSKEKTAYTATSPIVPKAKEKEITPSATLPAASNPGSNNISFGGLDDDNAEATKPSHLKQAKAAVPPSLAMSFGGLEDADAPASQPGGGKPKDTSGRST